MSSRRFHTAYNVSANNWLLRRYACVEERFFTMLSGWIWTTPGLEHKIELARLAYEDALHTDALQGRAGELYPPTEAPPRPAATEMLTALGNEIANAETLAERLVGVFRVLKPDLLAAYRQHLAETDEITDGPTAAILKRLIVEEEEHLAWGNQVLENLEADAKIARQAAAWENHLHNLVRATGTVRQPGAQPGLSPAFRNPAPPRVDLQRFPARDGRFQIVPVDEYQVHSMGETPNDILRHLLYANTYGEMEAEDMLGEVIMNAPEFPWPMRLDLARQMWDEARHAELSWRRMEELGGAPQPLPPIPPVILGTVGEATDPLERLIILQRAIEGRVAERHRYRAIHIARDLGDAQTARLFEYIVADERAHIGYSEWIEQQIGADPERLKQLEQRQLEAEQRLEDILSRRIDTTAGKRTA